MMDATSLSPEVRRLLGGVRLYSDDRPYVVVSLPLDQLRPMVVLWGGLASPFAVMMVDKDEITIVMHEMDWSLGSRGLPGARVESGYRLITFDATIDLSAVGFMAAIGRALGEAGLPILPLAAFSRDHILVREQDFATAWRVLSDLIAACRTASD